MPCSIVPSRVTMLWIYDTYNDFVNDNYRLVIGEIEQLLDYLVPGPYYRIFNSHDLTKYILARFYDGYVRVGGCLLLRLTGNVRKVLVPGDLDTFRKFARDFMKSRKPEKVLLRLLKRRGAVLHIILGKEGSF